MSKNDNGVERFDPWLGEDSEAAALVMRQWLESVEGRDAVIFPPTFARPERAGDGEWTGYNTDRFDDGSTVCLIDSVGSQANRMEPVFMRAKYRHLVPQVVIKLSDDKRVHLLEAGHRAGDAIARFAGKAEGDESGAALGHLLWSAFKAWQASGDAEPLARLAPTSLVFGAWDSRGTQAKIPRIVRSVVRAYDVRMMHRSAQFNTPLHYVDEGFIDASLDKGEGEKNPLSQEGFRHSPAVWSHGGIEVRGEIRREVAINLVALRSLGINEAAESSMNSGDRTLALRRYVLGLALVAATCRDERLFNLREGCLLRIAKSAKWRVVPFEGDGREVPIDPEAALAFADEAARAFSVATMDRPFIFNAQGAKQWLNLKKEERDKRRRSGSVVNQDLSK